MRRGPLLVTIGIVAATGCSIRPDSAPHDIPADKQRELSTAQPEVEGAPATGNDRIYLVTADGQHLRTVARQIDGPQVGLLQVLFDGPNEDELGEGLTTYIPDDVELNQVTVSGEVVSVDISEGIRDLPSSQLVLAVAQIVHTASQLVTDGTGKVVIRVDGDAQPWPNAARIEVSGPLTIFDFVGLAETSQPAYPQRSPQLERVTTAPPPTTGDG